MFTNAHTYWYTSGWLPPCTSPIGSNWGSLSCSRTLQCVDSWSWNRQPFWLLIFSLLDQLSLNCPLEWRFTFPNVLLTGFSSKEEVVIQKQLVSRNDSLAFSCSFERWMSHWNEWCSREVRHLWAAGCCHAVRSVTSHRVASDSALRLWVVRKKTVMWADCQLEMESSASESPCVGMAKNCTRCYGAHLFAGIMT